MQGKNRDVSIPEAGFAKSVLIIDVRTICCARIPCSHEQGILRAGTGMEQDPNRGFRGTNRERGSGEHAEAALLLVPGEGRGMAHEMLEGEIDGLGSGEDGGLDPW